MSAVPRVLICHERFLPRFGADRVLILIGKELKARGWAVDFMGQKFPEDRLRDAANEIIEIPSPSDYIQFDLETATWLKLWISSKAPAYQLVIVGGWPFFSSISQFRSVAPKVLFIDCGVVPNEGYDPGVQRILDHLRELRRANLDFCTHIAANSDFTLRTQTLPETSGKPVARAVLNGIDHLFAPGSIKAMFPAKPLLDVRALKAEGRRPILLLGRFEKIGYKNSKTGLEVFKILRRADPSVVLLTLDHKEALPLDWEIQDHVVGLGFPDDETLVQVMEECELGLSVSLWEGFNLPIAEMYRLRRPALCFNLAAHPEVVLRPWFLCEDTIEMAAKAAVILTKGSKHALINEDDAAAYRARFTWRSFMEQIEDLLSV
ncbi:MAG: glycosyltransferase family 4 protein [Opitutaceae bacterium]|nr:glycosyltransferase family 4 protein [Opitutaceae bacterium]